MNEPDRHDTSHGDRSTRTQTEDLLVRAFAARTEQITHHSLRPGSPPAVNWAARGRVPLMLALAAGVVSVALVGGAAMTLTDRGGQSEVATSPTTEMAPPPSLTPSQTPASPTPDSSAGSSAAVPPPDKETAPVSRTVPVTYGPRDESFSLRTGGGVRTLTATVSNNLGERVDAAGDILTVTAEGATLRPGDVRVSLLDSGSWKPVGGTDGATHTAELARGSLDADDERTRQVRISLGSGFPAGVTGLRVSFFSDGGFETLTLSG